MKRPLQAALFSLLIVCALGTSLSNACDIILSQGMIQLSPYAGRCLNGLAHGYGEVTVSRELNSGKFTMSMEGMFRQGVLTKGKERGANGQYWYTGTFNNWQRWTGSMRTGLSYRGTAQQWNYTNGQEERVPIGTPANLEQDSLSHTQANGNNKVRNDPVLGAARKFIANGQREQFARAEKAQEEQRTTQEKERTSLSLNSTKVPRFMPQNKNENSTGNEERLAGQPQEQEANNPSEERGGIFGIPILGAFLKGMADGLPAQSARISDALKDAPGAYVDRKITEEKDRRERRKREAEERKKQEEIAKQEQERVASLAKRDQEAREAQARIDEEQKKQRAKQEEERLAYLVKQDQVVREAQARADEERKQRETQARSNTANPVSPPIAPRQPATTPANRQTPQPPPQVITLQPTNGQNKGPVSPGLSTPPSSAPITVPQHSPQIVIQQPAKGPVSPSLGANSPSLPTQNPPNQQVGQSNASREPANNTQLQQVSSVTKQNQTRSPVTPPANHQAQSPTYQQVLTPAEITWMNSLPPDDATRKLPPSTIARMKREDKWVGYVAGTNNTNQSIAQDKKDQERYEQRAETILKTAEMAGGVAQGALTVIPGGGVVGTGGKVVAKVIEKKVERDAVKTAVTRGVDAASTGGITKIVTKTIDPTDIRFSQSTISRNFSSGSSIDELAAGLQSGAVKPSEIPPIRLVEKDGQLFTLDNRRLEAFRRAGVKVPYRMATPQEIEAEAWKFTTGNGGTSTRIRGN